MGDDVRRQLGDYRIIEEIGVGGMSRVFLAENIHHHKKYALKILPEKLSKDSGFRKRFFDEARVMSELDHPNIVRVHHMGEDKGVYYLVMDYVCSSTGKPRSLHEELSESPKHRINPQKALKWIVQITEGLDYAHRKGVLHRDIKPANILITSEGNVRITDFGLVKAIGAEFILSQIHDTIVRKSLNGKVEATVALGEQKQRRDTLYIGRTMTNTLTNSGPTSYSSGGLLGTYDYMSPEMFEGKEASVQSDIYSLGVTIYRMLTGKRAAGMPNPPSKLVHGLPKSWDLITRRCLVDSMEDRYPSVQLLLEDLRKVQDPHSAWMRIFILITAAAICVAATFLVVLMRERSKSVPVQTPSYKMPVTKMIASEKTQEAPMRVESEKTQAAPIRVEGEKTQEAPMRVEGEKTQEAPMRVEGEKTQETPMMKGEPKSKTLAQESYKLVKDIDRKQGLGTLIDNVEKELDKGDYESVVKDCEIIKARDKKRQDARYQKSRMEQASAAISLQGGAENYDKGVLKKAEQLCQKGISLFESGKFEAALESWKEAETHFLGVTRVDKARGEYKRVVGYCDLGLLSEVDTARRNLEMLAEKASGDADYDKAVDFYTQATQLLYNRITLAKEKTIELAGKVKLEFVLVSLNKTNAGETFNMGAPSTEAGSKEDERPVHKVKITKPFYMGKYEVTQAQYKAIMNENPSHFKDDLFPVEMVSWDDAQEFCARLNKKKGERFRLPTEAEWEYACRAKSTSAYCNGESYEKSLSKVGYCRRNTSRTNKVGGKQPNIWGLYDMHGNVFEWCMDWYEIYSIDPTGITVDPQGPSVGKYKVVRGGAWDTEDCRSAMRLAVSPQKKANDIGFRIILEADEVFLKAADY